MLIFTPRTGEEMRELLGEHAHVLAERVRGALVGEASYLNTTDHRESTPPG